MRTFWLMDQHGEKGPTALVETDGAMRISRILRFGPAITELEDQKKIQIEVMGKIAPSLKPVVDGASITVESVEPHPELRGGSKAGSGKANRAERRTKGARGRSGRGTGSGPSRTGGRGDR